MIKAVSFDFYNTLVRFWPPLEEIQQAACHELGLTVGEKAITHGYAVADVLFNRENEERPLSNRTDEERLDFFGRYEQLILETAGISVSMDLAQRVWKMAIAVPKDFVPFSDTVPTLENLRELGYTVGIITNLRRDLDELCTSDASAVSIMAAYRTDVSTCFGEEMETHGRWSSQSRSCTWPQARVPASQ